MGTKLSPPLKNYVSEQMIDYFYIPSLASSPKDPCYLMLCLHKWACEAVLPVTQPNKTIIANL